MIPRQATGNRGRGRLRTGSPGFTLIEVLIALSVLVVTMTMVFTLFSAGMKLRSATRDRMAFDRDARLVVGALMNDFANLVPSGPEPLVSADSIVMWCRKSEVAGGVSTQGTPVLVTYQWSGSGLQDSMLVRVVAPIAVDIADSGLVHREFMRWARIFQGLDVTRSHLLREDEGTRFGSRATLNQLSGTWLAYPHIRGFAFGISEDPDEDQGAATRSRILVRLSSEKRAESLPWQDALTSLTLLPGDDAGLEVALWLPLEAKVPLSPEEAASEGGLP